MTEQKTYNPGGYSDEQLLQLGRLLAPALARVEAREATPEYAAYKKKRLEEGFVVLGVAGGIPTDDPPSR